MTGTWRSMSVVRDVNAVCIQIRRSPEVYIVGVVLEIIYGSGAVVRTAVIGSLS